jgi:nucleotide sugar dehydrogenase
MVHDISIIGQGFVGSAIREGMRHAFKVVTYDIKQADSLVTYDADNVVVTPAPNRLPQLVRETTGPIFVCLPTPMKADGSCDTSLVENVVKEINDSTVDVRIVVIKSTVPPGTTDRLNQTYKSVCVCFNPEFLTEKNAVEDFKNQDRIIIGGPHEGTTVLKQVYAQSFPDVPVTKTSATIAEMVKYVTNCFLATKVSFANEIKQICDNLEIDYDKVIEYATKDERLGMSHWSVPGTDGTGLRGWGGSCFPKDLNALISLSEQLNVNPAVMEAVWKKNLEVRPERDWEQLKGRAVIDE